MYVIIKNKLFSLRSVNSGDAPVPIVVAQVGFREKDWEPLLYGKGIKGSTVLPILLFLRTGIYMINSDVLTKEGGSCNGPMQHISNNNTYKKVKNLKMVTQVIAYVHFAKGDS